MGTRNAQDVGHHVAVVHALVADLLTCAVMPYAWGSRTAIATLQGRPVPSPQPEAELWMGAHPSAPSFIARAGAKRPLGEVIAEDAPRELGAVAASRFGARLPFLLKVLAADQPLSLQAHPTDAQAMAGFDDEERRGIPRDAPHRNYKDPHHKPELICALTPFDALCGFRRVTDTLALAAELRVLDLDALLAPLGTHADSIGLSATFHAVMTMDATVRERAVRAVVDACRAHRGRFERECTWIVRLDERYPGDAGVISALLLNLIRLEPGEGIYLDAGSLHAYLHGVGIELMASSDNVLRGGLTPKHVDVPELVKVLRFTDSPVPIVRERQIDEHESAWDTPAAEFRLTRVRVAGRPVARAVGGSEIVFCVEGLVQVTPQDGSASVALARGQSAFIAGATSAYILDGQGVVFRAAVPSPSWRRSR